MTFVARPSLWRNALLVLGSLVFVLLGAWIAGLFGPAPNPDKAWSGWLCLVFFGLMGAVGIKRLFDRDDVLRINGEGIWYRLHADVVIPWTEIVEIGVFEYRGQKSIMLSLRDPSRYPASGVAKLLAAANRGVAGGDVAINLTATDRSFAEAAAAIDRFWQQ